MTEREYLAHFGIKGMRWGVRRFQNEDGSLTNAGRNRYGEGLEGKKVGFGNKLNDRDSRNWDKKDAGKLSKKELSRRIANLRKEEIYINAVENSRYNRPEARRRVAKKIAKYALISAAVAGAVGASLVGVGVYQDVKAARQEEAKRNIALEVVDMYSDILAPKRSRFRR